MKLESVRRVLDPVQSRLIPAHVTLCREDEFALVESDDQRFRLADVQAKSLTLQFGKPEVFHGHGILLPCISGEQEFHSLREQVLGSRTIRRESPHITLAHPRNPKSAGNRLSNANVLPEAISVTFTSVVLIQQTDAAAWQLMRSFELGSATLQPS